MCQLLGMNCNTPTDILFSFEGFHRRGGLTDQHADGFGIAFFEGVGCRLFLDDQASAHFFAAQPEVRQALEAALPRLREMMQDAGVQLGQANVSADTARQQDNSPRDTPRTLPGFADNGTEGMADVSLAALPARTGRGLVDTFA